MSPIQLVDATAYRKSNNLQITIWNDPGNSGIGPVTRICSVLLSINSKDRQMKDLQQQLMGGWWLCLYVDFCHISRAQWKAQH